MLTIRAPAKINLTLEVLGRRPDGFHEIRSIIQGISLSDILHFELSEGLIIESDMPGWIAEESLVSKAAASLKEVTGRSEGATVRIEKRIPLMAGLGGDSSDAAAVLRGLNLLWELNLPLERLLELAQQLGSDVSFFLFGGTALVEGRGEVVTSLPQVSHSWLVLALPPVPNLPGKTGRLYGSLRANHFTDGQITRRLVEAIRAGEPLSPSLLFNTFENIAFTSFEGLGAAREHFLKLGAADVHLAGSGPALFTLASDNARAEQLYSLLARQRMNPFIAETVSGADSLHSL